MTRRIEHRGSVDWPAERVYAAFLETGYWTARLSAFGDKSELVEHAVRADGLRVQLRQVVRVESIPPVARAVAGSDLTINRCELWHPEREGHYTGEVTADVPGMPCSITGSLLLRDVAEASDVRSELVVEGSVRVSLPLLGGKLENLFVNEIGQLLADEDRFTSDWLSRQYGSTP